MASLFSIRRARPEEAGRLTAVAHAAKHHWGYPAAWMEAWASDLTFTPAFVAENPVYVAAGADDAPVGCYALVLEEHAVHLEHLWVDPPSMGLGLGRRLFRHAVETAWNLGGTVLLIDADPNAEAFYARMGAERAGAVRADVCGVRRELPRLRYALSGTV